MISKVVLSSENNGKGSIRLSSNFRAFSYTQYGRLYCIQIQAVPVSLSPYGQM